MIVTLDSQRLDTSFSADCTLQTLIEHVRAVHEDRLIVSVAVDGTLLGDDELGARLDQPVAADSQIDLESGDAQQIVSDALQGLAIRFGEAGSQLAGIAEQLSAGDASDAVREIGQYVGLWNTCHRVIGQCAGLIDEDLTQREYDGRPVQLWFDDVVEQLVNIREALEARDMVLLADVVRYELPPLCETWQALLSSLAGQIPVPAATT